MLKIAVIACVMTLSTIARAEEWSLTTEHKYSKEASIRVIEPDGYTVAIGEVSDTVPTVLKTPNADAYIVVKFTSPTGRSWEKKVEVRAGNQTIVRVKHTPPGAPAAEPGKAVKKHIGTIQNTTNKCQKKSNHKFDFMADGVLVKSVELESGRFMPNVELPAGTYDVRRFDVVQKQWVFVQAAPFPVTKDGWVYSYGCN